MPNPLEQELIADQSSKPTLEEVLLRKAYSLAPGPQSKLDTASSDPSNWSYSIMPFAKLPFGILGKGNTALPLNVIQRAMGLFRGNVPEEPWEKGYGELPLSQPSIPTGKGARGK